MDYGYMFKDLISCRGNLNKWLLNRVASLDYGGYRSIPLAHIDRIGTAESLFYVDSVNPSILDQVETEYCFDDLRTTDVVLDIGANTGVFSLKVRDKVKEVYSVEPLFVDDLNRNIELNAASSKIKVLPFALSCNDKVFCEFGSMKATAKGCTLTELKKMCGGHVDFLKCDCEGGEWCIMPHELEGIRRIEAEIHSFNGEVLQDFIDMLESSGYDVTSDNRTDHTILVHAVKVAN